MKRILLFMALASLVSPSLHAQEKSENDSIEVVIPQTGTGKSSKEEKNRNVMLNAENATGPRNVNIGLPFKGDLIISENDVPVVYYFFPTNPLYTWRKDNSLSRMGMLSFEEGALLYGKVGNPVQSFTRDASRKHQGYASIGVTSNGSSKYDATFTGPLDEKGLGYMIGAFKNFDRGNGINYQFTPWNDNTTMIKMALQKKYDRGQVKLLYKFAESQLIMSNYVPLKYKGDGEFEELDNFDLGKDSYIPGSGLIPYKDAYGNVGIADLASDKFSKSLSHNLYIVGSHKFKNNWNLDYTTMYQKIKSPMSVIFPISTLINTDANGGIGSQTAMNQLIPQSDCDMFSTRAEFNKQMDKHRLRIGVQHQYYHRMYETYAGQYTMSVEANPKIYTVDRATGAITYFDGKNNPEAFISSSNGNLYDDKWNKTALYVSDDFSIGNRIDLGLGVRIEHQNYEEVHNQYNSNENINGPLMNAEMNNKFNKVGVGNVVIKATKNFGFLADGCYNSNWEMYWDYDRGPNGTPIAVDGNPYPRTNIQRENESVVTKWGAGVYYNLGSKLSVVSKVTGIKKTNTRSTENGLYNPVNHPLAIAVRDDFGPEFYDIETIGWTTDIMAEPIKNFNIHFLVTFQDPKYKKYSLHYKFDDRVVYGMTVPGSEGSYDYSDNQVVGLSKVLLEIDPSYKFYKNKMKAWFSLRYFGKQYGTATNAISYKPWWENFGGLEYSLSRNVKVNFTVINFLDQRGIKGDLVNSMQMTEEPAAGTAVVASAIRPRQFELSVDFKF